MSYRNYGYDEDELSGAFSSLSVKKGRGSTVGKSSGAKFPEYEEELQKRPLSSARRTGPPPCGPCAVVSNQAVRRRLGVEGDPSVDIDHIYEKHRAEVRGQNADIEGNKELAPSHLNRRWGQLYRHGKDEQVEQEKREYYGDGRYEEAIRAVGYCNKKYDYRKK